VADGETPLWTWTELPRFATFCRQICEATGASYENDFDEIRWAIEEDILRGPLSVSHPDPRFSDERRRYFRTAYAPARVPIGPLVVIFRVARYPEFGKPGEIEGREVWMEEDLRQIGFELAVSDGSS
jgi:hypothetical protein